MNVGVIKQFQKLKSPLKMPRRVNRSADMIKSVKNSAIKQSLHDGDDKISITNKVKSDSIVGYMLSYLIIMHRNSV